MSKIFLVLMCLIVMQSTAEEISKVEDISREGDIYVIYSKLNSLYHKSMVTGNCNEAYKAAEEMLSIDPSQSLAFLKFAVAAEICNITIGYEYEIYGSTRNELESEMRLLSEYLLINIE